MKQVGGRCLRWGLVGRWEQRGLIGTEDKEGVEESRGLNRKEQRKNERIGRSGTRPRVMQIDFPFSFTYISRLARLPPRASADIAISHSIFPSPNERIPPFSSLFHFLNLPQFSAALPFPTGSSSTGDDFEALSHAKRRRRRRRWGRTPVEETLGGNRGGAPSGAPRRGRELT